MPYTFRDVIKNLGEALEQHRVDLEFEPIGRILRLEFNDDYNSKRQIYVDGGGLTVTLDTSPMDSGVVIVLIFLIW